VLARIIEVGIGIAIAAGVIAFTMHRSCSRFRTRHPTVGEVWRSASRATRRRVRRAIRSGRAIERDDAVAAVDGIDTTLKIRRAQRIKGTHRVLRRRLLSHAALLLIAVVAAAITRPSLSALAAVYAGYFGVFVLLGGIALVQRRHWDHRWLPRLLAARQSAVDALAR
jgi:hypothetical protein